ncbi:MAG: hypothetical protein ACI9WC_000207 [Arenicella sp.]|jgi:hypothetical protein
MHKTRNVSAAKQSTSAGSLSKTVKRNYSAPSVLSSEPLEAVAAVCEEKGAGGPGKTPLGPFGGCTAMGS